MFQWSPSAELAKHCLFPAHCHTVQPDRLNKVSQGIVRFLSN